MAGEEIAAVKVWSDRETEIIEYHLARQNAAQSYNADMAKWILASLLFVNGAPFLLVSDKLATYVSALKPAVGYFCTGLALAVLCGFCAWLNTGMREAVGGYTVKRLLEGKDAPAGRAETASAWIVKASYVLSILTGFGSLAAFSIGAAVLSVKFNSG